MPAGVPCVSEASQVDDVRPGHQVVQSSMGARFGNADFGLLTP